MHTHSHVHHSRCLRGRPVRSLGLVERIEQECWTETEGAAAQLHFANRRLQSLEPERAGLDEARVTDPSFYIKPERLEYNHTAKFDKMLDPESFWGAHRRLECAQSDSMGPNSLDVLRSHLSGSACWLSRSREAF